MSTRILLPLTLLTLVVACADRSDPPRPAGIDSAIAAYQAESTAAASGVVAAAPAPKPVVKDGDTLVAEATYLCGKEMAVAANYWNGATNRAWLRLLDTVLDLPQTRSASGARYGENPPGPEWWLKGDSARLSWNHQTLRCVENDSVLF